MNGFEPVHLAYGGQTFSVEADRMLEMVARVEEALAPTGGNALSVLLRPGGPGIARLAKAYGSALRYAGARVTDEEVYFRFQETMASGDEKAAAAQAQDAIIAMIHAISPPVYQAIAGTEDVPGKVDGSADGGLIRNLYSVIVGQGWLAPRDFWRLRPAEVWWLIDSKMPPEVETEAGKFGRLLRMVEDAVGAE